MPYETIIKQVKILPEAPLASVSNYLNLRNAILLKTMQCKKQTSFFALTGELHLDRNAVTELREVSLI